MTSKEIARTLKLTGLLYDLHNENPNKAKSLASASYKIEKSGIELEDLTVEQIAATEGLGKMVATMIDEIRQTGGLEELEKLFEKTPPGVIKMLSIKGLGPKKVAALWNGLSIISIDQLLKACEDNQIASLKGFGAKTQEQILTAIKFSERSKGKFLHSFVIDAALSFVEQLKKQIGHDMVSLTSDIRRRCEIIESVDIILVHSIAPTVPAMFEAENIPVNFILTDQENYWFRLFETTGNNEHVEKVKARLKKVGNFLSEEEIYKSAGLQYIEPELRENRDEISLAETGKIPSLVILSDLKGILHNHTDYSDGLHSLPQMAEFCMNKGYEYIGICDHSQSAYYAGGLKEQQVIKQQQEIDELNKKLAPFKIFKGIESDILMNGSLDYTPEILKTFDFVVASIHANQKMNEETSNNRLITAIENPFTTILGHMSGRLLLSRSGYPLDHKKVIDACAANNVIIELNSHPNRLDIDWRWISYCMDKGVMISINPDAHQMKGLLDIRFGTDVARKGMLTKEMCFNALSREEISAYFQNRKTKNGLN